MKKQLFTQCNLIVVKVYPVAFALWSAPCLLRTLFGSVPSTSFNILHHPFTLANTTRHQCPTPARALLHEQRVPKLVLPLLQLHCSLQHCPGNHQLRSSNDPQEKKHDIEDKTANIHVVEEQRPKGLKGTQVKDVYHILSQQPNA